jgi:predicted GTPase
MAVWLTAPDMSRLRWPMPQRLSVPEIVSVFRDCPHIGRVLTAVGYGAAQLRTLAATVNTSAAELVISATPIDLARADFT